MTKVKLNPEYTAQASIATPNRMIKIAIENLKKSECLNGSMRQFRVADQGCGKLRHLNLLLELFQKVYLIDKEEQLLRKQRLFDKDSSIIPEYISSCNYSDRIKVFSNTDFANKHLRLDLVLNACTFDVVLNHSRKEMVDAAYRNLRKGGYFVLIIPRNDQSITKRCFEKNRYHDGHVFEHHSIRTFFKNYKNHSGLIRVVKSRSYKLLMDLSTYRQVCLIFQKQRIRKLGT